LIVQQSQVKPANIQPPSLPVDINVVVGTNGAGCAVWGDGNYLGSGSSVYDQSGVFMGCLLGQIVYHSS
jgi:hypothetical protein